METSLQVTREEHLAKCKADALKYCDRNDPMGALTAMFCDLEKHPETKNHPGIQIGFGLMMIGSLGTVHEARRFIEGFN